jgi:hypothetical protein
MEQDLRLEVERIKTMCVEQAQICLNLAKNTDELQRKYMLFEQQARRFGEIF